ncbi:hypothetical protein CEV33_1138 [Brucella grignonensis]|uniref:Uncharacterized protein n=1 Tax=Brucella grignonensis TaxID=94627 RepID=A0A256FBY7_9HYPH|nr:hypothetical protein CEV33_1138 [Brucella grignonensis]
MLEPTAFKPDTAGARLEFTLHMTENGCQVLTGFKHRLSFSRLP